MTQPKEGKVQFKEQAYQVDTQTPTITDASLPEAKRLIGFDLHGGQATIEITRDLIRQFCRYSGSTNPVHIDEGYARYTRWGGVIAPPMLVGMAAAGPGLRGIQWIWAGTEWEVFEHMRPGDTITQRLRLVDASEKRVRTVPRMILQTMESTCANQRDELVARVKLYQMRTPRRGAPGGGMDYALRQPHWDDASLRDIEAQIDAEKRRGANPRYWEDTVEGEAIPAVLYGPLRAAEIAFTGGFTDSAATTGTGQGHGGGFVYQLLNRRRHPADTYVDPETGAQDHPHRGHWEQFMATEVGMPGIYDIGTQRIAWLNRLVGDWMGDDAVIKKIGGWLRRPNLVGDVTWMKGKVTRKWVENNEHLVHCELWGENQNKETNTTGYAVVRLLSKAV